MASESARVENFPGTRQIDVGKYICNTWREIMISFQGKALLNWRYKIDFLIFRWVQNYHFVTFFNIL